MARKYDRKEYETVKKTVYAEARGESEEGQKAVASVILNRAKANTEEWGGSRLDDVCRKDKQFSCWNGESDIPIREKEVYDSIDKWLPDVLDGKSKDPTDGCCHYNNPKDDNDPDWARKIPKAKEIGNHQFYKY